MDNFKDVEAIYIESDIDKIKRKPLMYIRQFGEEGILHLIWEVIQNAFDECIDENSPGDHIYIEYDRSFNILSVQENGRGFPENNFSLDIYCTKIQSGSKFDRQSGGTSGEFGVGLTVVNALSSIFRIQSRRLKEKQIHTLEFANGLLISDEVTKLKMRGNDFKHGSVVACSPSSEYFGDVKIPFNLVKERVDKIMHLINTPKNITVEIIESDNGAVISSEVLEKKPFVDMINAYPFEFVLKSTIQLNVVTDVPKDTEKRLHGGILSMDVIMSYGTQSWNDTYCNFTNTIDGGIHLDVVEEVLSRYISNETKKRLSDSDKDKLQITWNDVKDGLVLLINMNTVEEVFIGNAKTKILKQELVPYLKDAFTFAVTNYFESNQSVLNKICQLVKTNAKMRLDVNRIRGVKSKNTSRFDDYRYGLKYVPANNRGKNQFRELFIVEGGSAMNIDCRDPNTQAFLSFRGNPANIYKTNDYKLLDPKAGNPEWIRYVDVIKTGWGTAFNPDNVYFDRINILTDADIDGLSIAGSIAGFNMKVLYPLIERGIVYKVMPPLYKTSDPRHEYIRNKREMIDAYYPKIFKKVRVYITKNTRLPIDLYKDLLYDTYDYPTTIQTIATNTRINTMMIELFVVSLIQYFRKHKMKTPLSNMDTNDIVSIANTSDDFNNILMRNINKWFYEMKLERNGFILGVHDGKEYLIIVDNHLVENARAIFSIFEKYGDKFYLEYDSGKLKEITLSELVKLQHKEYPSIQHRYKGLGEMNANELWDTVFNPDNRYSIQLTTKNYQKELQVFDNIYGAENIAIRKEMHSKYVVNPLDIDT